MIDLLVANPHLIPIWLAGFLLSISAMLGIWWIARNHPGKGTVALLVIGVLFSFMLTSPGEDCDAAGSEPCEELDPMLPMWIMLSLFAPDVTESIMSNEEGKAEAKKVFGELDEAKRDATYRGQQACDHKYREASAEALASGDQTNVLSSVYGKCMEELETHYGVSGHVVTLILEEKSRQRREEYRVEMEACNDMTAWSCFEYKAEREAAPLAP